MCYQEDKDSHEDDLIMLDILYDLGLGFYDHSCDDPYGCYDSSDQEEDY